jgi:hypothetical protein
VGRLRLHVENADKGTEAVLVSADGEEYHVALLRVRADVRFGSVAPHYIRRCIVDSGAPLSVIPEYHWRKFESDIEWLRPTTALPRWLTRPSGYMGGECPCRLGLVEVVALRYAPGVVTLLKPVRLLAQFLEDGPDPPEGRERPILIGLQHSIHRGCRFGMDVDQLKAVLEER